VTAWKDVRPGDRLVGARYEHLTATVISVTDHPRDSSHVIVGMLFDDGPPGQMVVGKDWVIRSWDHIACPPGSK